MHVLKGLAVSEGIAMGPVRLVQSKVAVPQRLQVADAEAQRRRAEKAMHRAAEQLEVLHADAENMVGQDVAAIFEVQLLMLEDEDFRESIFAKIESDKLTADYAVYASAQAFAAGLVASGDATMAERAADVMDLCWRMLGLLAGSEESTPLEMAQPCVVAAAEWMPSQTLRLDKSKVLAFLSKSGGTTGHAAILARALGVPAVTALEAGYAELVDGQFVIVDGSAGEVILSPGQALREEYRGKMAKMQDEARQLGHLAGLPAQTVDGSRVLLEANISHLDEVEAALENGAEGVGLFRSENIFMQAEDFPSEAEQYAVYRALLAGMAPRRVVVRTLDIGSDKQAAYFPFPHEDNPALGYRGIRVSLDRKDLFRVHLRAILRASAHGRLAVLFPMIVSEEELLAALQLAGEVRAELLAEGQAVAEDIEYGVMIETPAAVMIADRLARHAGFFSIGTNDLTQYTYAADRTNAEVASLYRPGGLPVLRMIAHTVQAAHRQGIPVAICGESAAEAALIPHYVAMGVDALSMAPARIPKAKQQIRGLDKAECLRQWQQMQHG